MSMKAWAYTDGEIRTMYGDAKDRKAQIRIIAELCNRSESAVIEKLCGMGFEIQTPTGTAVTPRKKKKISTPIRWTPEEIEKVRCLAEDGAHVNTICKTMHCGWESLNRMLVENGINVTKYGDIPEKKLKRILELRQVGMPWKKIAKIVHISYVKIRQKMAEIEKGDAIR